MVLVVKGIKNVYENLGFDLSKVKFLIYIVIVVIIVYIVVIYFKMLKENGFLVDIVGISFYFSVLGVYIDKMVMYKKIVIVINK